MQDDTENDHGSQRFVPLTISARRLITLGFALSGAAALMYEVTWTRELSLVFSSTVYAVSMMVAAFMAGLSFGGYLGGRRADSGSDPVRDLAMVEFAIAVTGLLSPLTIRFLPYLQFQLLTALKPSPPVFFVLQMAMAFVVMIVPTTFMGATFPLVSKISVTTYGKLGRTMGGLYSANTLGAIAGSLAAGFMLVPLIGVSATIFVAGALNLTVSLLIMFATRRSIAQRVVALAALVAVGSAASLALPEPAVPLSFGMAYRFGSYDAYRTLQLEHSKRIWQDENAYGRVAVVEDPASGFRYLVNDSLIEGSNGDLDRATTSLLSMLPAAYAPNPRDVLVVGLGTGLTSRAALELPVDSVTTVEINPAMDKASGYFLGSQLHDDPRWNLVNADARMFLQVSERRFDVITSEPSWPLASAVAPLFTQEFFQGARDNLATGGVFCQWLPEYLLDPKDRTLMLNTFRRVFPDARAWIVNVDGSPNGDMFLIGTAEGSVQDDAAVQREVNRQLASMGYANVEVVPAPDSEFVSADDPANSEVNTDDKPLLEFHVPWTLVDISEGKR